MSDRMKLVESFSDYWNSDVDRGRKLKLSYESKEREPCLSSWKWR